MWYIVPSLWNMTVYPEHRLHFWVHFGIYVGWDSNSKTGLEPWVLAFGFRDGRTRNLWVAPSVWNKSWYYFKGFYLLPQCIFGHCHGFILRWTPTYSVQQPQPLSWQTKWLLKLLLPCQPTVKLRSVAEGSSFHLPFPCPFLLFYISTFCHYWKTFSI